MAVVAFVWMGADEGGFHGTTFLPATLAMLALLIVGLVALPLPRPTRVRWIAIAALAAYAVWTYLSILWADQQGLALDSANRTALYAITLALFALWPVEGRVAAGLTVAFSLGIAALGSVELIRAAGAEVPIAFFDEGRLSEPTGYANANVALWTTALLPALIFAGRRQTPALLRGALLAAAGLLTALAILGQSRGWAGALPAIMLLAVAIVPGRGRTIAAIALTGAATAAVMPTLLDVYERFDATASNSAQVSAALTATAIASGLLFLAGVAWGLAERSAAFAAPRRRRQLGTGLIACFVLLCAAAAVTFSVERGNPVTAAGDAWSEFTQGGKEPHFDGARIGSLGGTWRYDYWEVAWDEFTANPLTGVGGDNFGRDYLIHGKSRQTPAYPHNVAIRALSQTGLIGALLLGASIVAAALGAARTLRREQGLAAASAACGLLVFAYFIVHGLLDWFWEFPALGAPAFALLGLATATVARPAERGRERRPGAAALAVGALPVLVLVPVLALPWLAERDLRSAREIASSDPAAALEKLNRAADLNPLSPLADKTAAVILTREGLPGAAERRLRATLDDDPGDPFVYLQLAALASAAGRDREARRLIAQAARLSPRDAVTAAVRRRLELGRTVTTAEVNRMILRDVNTRIGRE